MTKTTYPTHSLLKGMPYTPSHKTDIRETFKRFLEKTQTVIGHPSSGVYQRFASLK
jgi:hypothetical protein